MSQLHLKSFVVPYKKQHKFCETTHFFTVKNTIKEKGEKGKEGRKNICYKNTTEKSDSLIKFKYFQLQIKENTCTL